MIHICLFNKDTDVKPTRVGLNIDLSRALREGIVKDSGIEPEFNNIDDPTKIRGRVSDSFEAIETRNAVLHKASVSPSTETPDDDS